MELERFTEHTPTRAEQRITNPLAWWQGQQSTYPILHRMANDLFSIPAMSSECEHEFSSADNVITDERNHLNDNTVTAPHRGLKKSMMVFALK